MTKVQKVLTSGGLASTRQLSLTSSFGVTDTVSFRGFLHSGATVERKPFVSFDIVKWCPPFDNSLTVTP